MPSVDEFRQQLQQKTELPLVHAVNGNAGKRLCRADGQRRLHMADIGRGGEPAGQETLEIIPVMRDDLQQKIGLTHQHVAFAHRRPGADHILNFLQG